LKVAIAADHRGFALKEKLKLWIREMGHEPVDFGTDSEESTDYPDVIFPAAEAVASGRCQRGVFVCGSGIGVSIAANKVAGVHAARCCSEKDAEMCRRHNNANVMTLSGETEAERAKRMLALFIDTDFEAGRHLRRINKIRRRENLRDLTEEEI